MASSLLDVCRFNPTAGGTTDWNYSSAVTGYQSPSAAGVVNGATYSYRAESSDLSQWEVGTGSYNTSTGVLTRTTVLFNSSGTGTGSGQSGAGTKISFSATPQVAIVALAEDISKPNSTLQTPTNPAATSSGTGVMMGLGGTCTLTPKNSSRVLVSFYFIGLNTAATGSAQPLLYYGTGTAPTNGAATTGTSVGTRLSGQSINANAPLPFAMTAVITGLTPGTAYWFDLNLLAGGGTASISSITFSALEF